MEPNHRADDGTNPTEQIHSVTVPGIPMTSDWTDNFEPQSVTFPVTVANDSRYEPTDYLTAEILPSATNEHDSRSRAKFRILDDDRSTIALSANSTAVTEGDPLVFTLTRGNNTTQVDLIVGVSVLDPGGFLAGNLRSQAVEAPSSVVFAPGDVTASVNLTPPDDWRDIPDSALTFTVMAEPEYEITGPASITVPVADNDVAPQVQISFNAAEVDEGQDLVLTITRIGEDKNPLEIELTAGPKDDQQYTVAVMDAGESLLTLTYTLPDDDYKSLDTEYEATLHPGPPAFWTPATPTTVTARILDNDLYTVGIEAITPAVDEGQNLQYRVYHDGHTGDWVNVKVLRSEIGSAVRDSLLGERTHAMVPGESEADPLLFTEARDGNDGDATVIIEILPGDDYEIDPDHATATMVVRDKDPLPVLGFRDPSTRVSEGVGTVDLWVDIVSPLPSLRTVTVDYSVHDTYAGNGLSVTESAGTLTFAPGETSAAITVEVLQNSIAENNEIFAVVLTNPVYATLQDLQTSLTMLGVIEDDEPTVTVEARHPAVEEGDDVVLDLTRSGDTTGELTVWLWVSQTAPQALTRQDAVVFAAGNATAEHVIPTQDDSVRLGSYTVNASLLNPATVGKPRTYRLGSPSAAAATVRDNELSPVSLNTTNLRVIEGETITLELSRRWGTGTALTVNLSITETGQFTTGALPTSVTFGQLVDTRTIRIQTEDDRTAEDIGKLTVTLNDGTGYRAAWPNTHTFTVYDNDGAKPFVSVSADHDWVNEGEPVSFTVTRSGPTGNIMEARVRLTRVRYRVTAEDLSDPSRGITSPPSHVHFGKEELTLEFPAGTRTLTITRPTTDDNLNYGNSTYHALILNDPSDEYVAPYSQSAKVWVQDDDIPTVTGTSTLSEHNEGYNRVVIPFSRTGDVSGALELKSRITFTEFIPEPGQDITVTEPHTLVYSIQPGDASGLPVLTYGGVYFMGDGGHVQLLSHYCPGRPNACGYFPQYVVGNPSDITYRVYSDIMGVRIEADQVSVDEGEPATFTFHRLGGKPDSLTRSLQVNVLVSQEGGYISGGAPQTVTFAANEATTTLSIPTAEDMVDEADGSITVEILRSYERGDGDDRYGDDRYHYESNEYPGTPWEIYAATTVVTDDDYVPPTISISDASALETDRTISFTVSLDSANTEQAATVDWATAEDGSTTAATSDVDYTAASGALDFAIGETEKTITVALLDDELDEDNETFSVILSNPSEVILGDGTGSGAINDNELAFAVVWHSSTWHTEEGDDIVITFRRLVPLDPDGVVTTEDDCYKGRAASCFNSDLNADPGNLPLTINLAVTLEGDYFSGTAPASVTFPPGESLVNLLIPTVDDSNVEAKGTAIVQILQGSGYSPLLTGDFPGIVVPTRPHHVYDNDLTIAIDDAQADESSGQLDFTVRLNEAAPEQVTVDVATIDGEATSHANVTATSLGRDFHAKTETITFEAGEQQKTFSVALVDDKIHERDETLSAQLSIPPQSRNRYRINFSIYHGTLEQWPPITSLADGTGEGTIVDDEQPMAASVSRSYDVVNENQAGPVRFMVELSHADTTANERNVAVGWQVVAGTATEGEDYLAADGMLNFPVGSNTGALEVDLVDDHLFEKELETFTVELIDQGTRLATISPTGNSFVTSIRDNETLTASIMADALSVVEGGTAGFTVRLTGGVTQEDVQITFETGGDATGGSDYDAPLGNLTLPPGDNTGSAGTLTIPAGQKSGTITYPIKTDNIAEEDGETLEVQLFTVNDGLRSSGVSGSENIASTTILDGDSLIVSIQGNPTVAEGGTATFSVRLSETEAEDVSVEWATTQPGNPLGAGETAEPDLDYTADSGTVAIPAGSTSATFTIATNQDTLVEGDETFVVTLEQATKGTAQLPELLTLGVTMATGTITDDDTAPTGVTLSAVPDSVTEDAGATDISATVSLDGTAQFTHDTPVTIEFADRPGNPRNAIPGVDYTAAPVNTVIPAGESGVTAIITITPVDDNMEENDEIARLEAGSPDLSGTDALGVNITDNDTAVVEVELTATPGAVDETVSSTILTVTAALVGSSSRAIDTVINLSATDGTAESAEDYEFTDTTVTIPAGAMSATVSVSLTVLDDTLAEGDETFEIGGSITAASITVLPAEITIRDDDTEPTGIALSYSAAPLERGRLSRQHRPRGIPPGRRDPHRGHPGLAEGGRPDHDDERRLHGVLVHPHPDHTGRGVQRHRRPDHHPGGRQPARGDGATRGPRRKLRPRPRGQRGADTHPGRRPPADDHNAVAQPRDTVGAGQDLVGERDRHPGGRQHPRHRHGDNDPARPPGDSQEHLRRHPEVGAPNRGRTVHGHRRNAPHQYRRPGGRCGRDPGGQGHGLRPQPDRDPGQPGDHRR